MNAQDKQLVKMMSDMCIIMQEKMSIADLEECVKFGEDAMEEMEFQLTEMKRIHESAVQKLAQLKAEKPKKKGKKKIEGLRVG